MSILVIGNGFDLYHGLKTKYIDFVNFTKESNKANIPRKISDICKDNIFIRCFKEIAKDNDNWIDCEKEIESIVILFKKIIDDRKVFDEFPEYRSISRNKTSLHPEEFEKLLVMKKIIKQSDEQKILLRDSLFSQYNWINKEKFMNILKRDLDSFILLFRFYLKNYVQNKEITNLSKQILSLSPKYVVNFNYTDTYTKYGIARDKICFVHGSVDDKNIVLGTRDLDETDVDSIYFKKYFQRIQKRTDVINWNEFPYDSRIRLIKHNNIPNDKIKYVDATYFFGHSLSNTDGDLIRSIYKFSKNIIVFYLNDLKSNDYEKKVINLIDTLGKNTVLDGFYHNNIKFIPIE